MFFSRFRLLAPTALLLALWGTGCDTGSTSAPDAEILVGSWTGSSLNVRVAVAGGLSVPVPGVDMTVASATFGPATAARFTYDPPDDATLSIPQTSVSIPLPDNLVLTGTYVLDDANKRIRLTRPGVGADLVLGYRLRSDDDLEIIAEDAAALAVLIGLAGPDAAVLAGVVSGGSIRYSR